MSPTDANPPASRHYFQMMLESQTDRATPRSIIGLLYAELMRSLDRLIAIMNEAANDPATDADPESAALDAAMAQSILTALADSIDFDRGGALAPIMSRIYSQAGRDLATSLRASDIDSLRRLRSEVSDIAYSWQALDD
jgi:flagellar secretion chaperone FliS